MTFVEQKIITGSSKDFYTTADDTVLRVVFKDVIHGAGRKSVIAGTGKLRAEFCYYFYKLLEQNGIATHLAGLQALTENGLLVRKMTMLPLEVIVRYIARGQWADSHKWPILKQGAVLAEPIVEYCLKWKQNVPYLPYEQLSQKQKSIHKMLSYIPGVRHILMPTSETRDDPRVTLVLMRALNRYAAADCFLNRLLETEEEEIELHQLALRVNAILRTFLASQGWILEDGKFEVGITADRHFIVADEYTQDSSRVRDKKGNSLTKDLFRQSRSANEIYENYARLTEGIKQYVG